MSKSTKNKGIDLSRCFVFDIENTTEEPSHAYVVSFLRLSTPDLDNIYRIEYNGDYVDFMHQFIGFIFSKKSYTTFFAHNLSHDFSYIYSFLCQHYGGEFSVDYDNTIILDVGHDIKKITLMFRGKKFIFRDTFALFTASLDRVMKDYTDVVKGETPLFSHIEDVIITDDIRDYVDNDVYGLAVALLKRLQTGKNKITTAGDAFATLKDFVNGDRNDVFSRYFPYLEFNEDKEMRAAYRGGYTYLNPLYAEKTINDITVIDINSMYPAQMYYKNLPFGEPLKVDDGEIKTTFFYTLGIQIFSFTSAQVKDNCAPFLCESNALMGANDYPVDWFPDNDGDRFTFALTLQEFELFKSTYYYEDLQLHGGWLFQSKKGVFRSYIDHFWKMKNDRHPVIKALGKLFLNSPYGKFAEGQIKNRWKIIYEDKITFKKDSEEVVQCGYLPVGIFITSYARVFLLESINKIGMENFIYCDTDSIHFTGDIPDNIEMDDYKMGLWKKENIFTRAYYIRAKRYCGEYYERGEMKLKIACAGIKRVSLYEQIKSVDDFRRGVMIKTFRFRYGKNGKYTENCEIKI